MSTVTLLFIALCEPCLADPNFMKLGVSEYHAGDFANAAGHLGAALATDYNNATLHYYLANSYLRLNQRDGAIREFRIAYALQPSGALAQYSKTALAQLGADVVSGSQSGETKAGEGKPADKAGPAADASYDKAVAALKEQSNKESSLRSGVGQSAAETLAKRGGEVIKQTKDEMLNNIPQRYNRRTGTTYQTNLPSDSQSQLDSMRKYYDAQKSKYLESSAQSAKEIQKSSENLQSLLNDKPKPGEAKLVPAGTNLYIRNYQPVGH